MKGSKHRPIIITEPAPTRNLTKCDPPLSDLSVADLFRSPCVLPFKLPSDSREPRSPVINMPPPKNLKELRSMMGKGSYLRRFIPALAEVIHPFQDLLKKKAPFRWTESHESAFNAIKKILTSPQTMAAPQKGKPLILYLTSSNHSFYWGLVSTGNLRYGKTCILLNSPSQRSRAELSSNGKNIAWHMPLQSFAITC